MAAMVVMERHLWLNLPWIKEKEKTFLLDSLVSPSGLFSTSVEGGDGEVQRGEGIVSSI